MSAPKTEAPTAPTVQGFSELTGNNTHNCADAGVERKTLATLQAAFALRGYALHRLADGLLLAERWGYTRSLDNLTQAAQFLAQIGGR